LQAERAIASQLLLIANRCRLATRFCRLTLKLAANIL